MGIRSKILFFTMVLMVSLTTILTVVILLNMRGKSQADIIKFRESEIQSANDKLRSVVDLAYDILNEGFTGQDSKTLESSLATLRSIRFDSGEGYFWITDDILPFPTMIMHAAKPQNEGKVMSDEKYNVIKEKEGKNLYQERVELAVKEREGGFVDYTMVKPGDEKLYSKLSYSRYHSGLGWVISSGIYTDAIDDKVAVMEAGLSEQMVSIIYNILFWALGLLILGFLVAGYFSRALVQVIDQVKTGLAKMSRGTVVDHIVVKRKDELGDMMQSLNELVISQKKYSTFASEIGKGNIEASFNLEDENDVLGNSLLNMRNNLFHTAEEVKDVVKDATENGNLKLQISTEGKEGIWRDLSLVINELLFSINASFSEVNKVINAMSTGNLTERLKANSKGDMNTLAQNLDAALDNISKLLIAAKRNSEQIGSSSMSMLVASKEMNTTTAEIASAISQMSVGAQTQVTKVDDSSNLVEGILSSSKDMGLQAESINTAAVQGAESSEKGLKLIQKVGFSIKDIAAFSEDTNHSFQALSKRSNEIGQALGFITDVAAQTNLLALNAAIEAAQAGEAGRGFAVVAEEIRKLAEDSSRSAKEIERLVEDVKRDTNDAARVLEVMNESIKGGEEASANASTAFTEIASSTEDTLKLSENILNATKTQIEDIKNVVSMTEAVVVIAEQTAAGTEEVASSASELSAGMENYITRSDELTGIADELLLGIGQFKLYQKDAESQLG